MTGKSKKIEKIYMYIQKDVESQRKQGNASHFWVIVGQYINKMKLNKALKLSEK